MSAAFDKIALHSSTYLVCKGEPSCWVSYMRYCPPCFCHILGPSRLRFSPTILSADSLTKTPSMLHPTSDERWQQSLSRFWIAKQKYEIINLYQILQDGCRKVKGSWSNHQCSRFWNQPPMSQPNDTLTARSKTPSAFFPKMI